MMIIFTFSFVSHLLLILLAVHHHKDELILDGIIRFALWLLLFGPWKLPNPFDFEKRRRIRRLGRVRESESCASMICS